MYLQSFLNISKITKFEKLLNSGKVYYNNLTSTYTRKKHSSIKKWLGVCAKCLKL